MCFEHFSAAIDKADVLLGMKHGIVRLDDVWGLCGGNRPVKYLVRRVRFDEDAFQPSRFYLFLVFFESSQRHTQIVDMVLQWCFPVCCCQMNLLLKEYLSSGDISEATRCLKELDVPHFHHELIYEVGRRTKQFCSILCLDSKWRTPSVIYWPMKFEWKVMSAFSMLVCFF